MADWPARVWCVSDRLGLLASVGFVALAVNGQWLVEAAGQVPEGPLVPFVDLGSGPMAVSLEAALDVGMNTNELNRSLKFFVRFIMICTLSDHPLSFHRSYSISSGGRFVKFLNRWALSHPLAVP